MMKTSVLRQARFCRVALSAASRVQISSRTFPSASPLLSSTPRAPTAQYRILSSPFIRLYSSEAPAQSEDGQPARVTKFSDLARLGVHECLVDSIVHGMKYTDMTEVQSMTIDAALDGKDIVAQAKTGTGKTLAFLVPVIQRILNDDPSLALKLGGRPGSFQRRSRATASDIRAIIVSPTRELAEQIAVEAKKLVQNTGIKVQVAVGGTHKKSMLSQTQREGCHVLVATPGRLADLLADESSDVAAPRLQAFVLDEADRMLEQGFQKELEDIIHCLPDKREVPRQTLLFSATIPRNVIGLARDFINEQNFDFVQTISPDDVPTHEAVPQHIVPCRDFANTYATVLELIERETSKAASDPSLPPFKAMVFLGTTASVVMMAATFQRLAFHDKTIPKIFDIHSKLSQSQRTASAERFRRASSAILFSSDVTARGMDFPGVTHVIQVHLPQGRDQYIHRIGRTGRAGKEGQAWLIVSDMEIPTARQKLAGLPINRCQDLNCASVDAATESELPPQFERIKDAISHLPSHVAVDACRSYNAGSFQGQDISEVTRQSKKLAIYGWGLKEEDVFGRRRRSDDRFEDMLSSDGNFGGHNRGFGGHNRGFGGRDRGFGGRDRSFGGRGDFRSRNTSF